MKKKVEWKKFEGHTRFKENKPNKTNVVQRMAMEGV